MASDSETNTNSKEVEPTTLLHFVAIIVTKVEEEVSISLPFRALTVTATTKETEAVVIQRLILVKVEAEVSMATTKHALLVGVLGHVSTSEQVLVASLLGPMVHI